MHGFLNEEMCIRDRCSQASCGRLGRCCFSSCSQLSGVGRIAAHTSLVIDFGGGVKSDEDVYKRQEYKGVIFN